MPAGFASTRQRLQLTGLEEAEELWDRLKEATAASQALAGANQKLQARVVVLERQLSQAGGLTDDELVAELPKRMSRALESAQGVADEIVRRAKRHEAAIRQRAAESAAEIVHQAESQAAEIVNGAVATAAAHTGKAEAEALDIILAAQRRRKDVLAQLADETQVLQQRVTLLRRDQSRVLRAFDIVEQTLAESRRNLDEPERGPESAPVQQRSPRAAGPAKRNGHMPTALRSAVFDWSPTASNAG